MLDGMAFAYKYINVVIRGYILTPSCADIQIYKYKNIKM